MLRLRDVHRHAVSREIKRRCTRTSARSIIHMRRERERLECEGRVALSGSTKWITHGSNHASSRWGVSHQLSVDRRVSRAVRVGGKLATAG